MHERSCRHKNPTPHRSAPGTKNASRLVYDLPMNRFPTAGHMLFLFFPPLFVLPAKNPQGHSSIFWKVRGAVWFLGEKSCRRSVLPRPALPSRRALPRFLRFGLDKCQLKPCAARDQRGRRPVGKPHIVNSNSCALRISFVRSSEKSSRTLCVESAGEPRGSVHPWQTGRRKLMWVVHCSAAKANMFFSSVRWQTAYILVVNCWCFFLFGLRIISCGLVFETSLRKDLSHPHRAISAFFFAKSTVSVPLNLETRIHRLSTRKFVSGNALHETGLEEQTKSRSTGQQPGTKSFFRPGDKLWMNRL